MKLVRSGLRDDENLRAGTLAVFGAVGVAEHVEFANSVRAEQLLTGPARLHVVLSRAGEFDAVQQEQVLLRTVSRHGEVVPVGRIGHPDAAGFLPCEIYDSGIQREEFIVAASVKG